MNEPSEITSGFDYTWTESLSDYPADDGWTLKYKGINADDIIEFEADPDGSNHEISLTAADTAGYTPGSYLFTKYVEHTDGRKVKISSFNITILFDPVAAETPVDTRTHAEKMVEAIEALETGRATKEQRSFQIAGRSIEYLDPDALIKWKNHFKLIVSAEKGESQSKRRLVNFTNPL